MKYNPKLLSAFGQGGCVFGISLMDIASRKENVMVLSTDVSTPAGLDKFKATYPERFLNLGIAEQNMIGTASGLTDEGFKTISVAQACFISMRCFEPVRQYVGYMKSNQILIGFGSGFSLTFMGNTHYALEDIALMKEIAGMTVIAPSDAMQAMKALEAAVEHDGPVYIRLFGGTGTPIVYTDDFDYHIGKAIRLKEGKDIQLIATGSMVDIALKAATDLESIGLSVSVIDMHTIKPLDTSIIDMNSKLLVSLEEHKVIGGLGSSIADYLCSYKSHPKLLKIGVGDCFSSVGDYSYLMETNGLSSEKIVEKIKSEI